MIASAFLDIIEEERRRVKYTCYWEPHTEQQQFWAQLTPEQDTWIVLGGTGSGKTEVGAQITTAFALGKEYYRNERNWPWIEKLPIPPPPNNIRGIGLNSDMLRDPMWEKLTGNAEHGPFFPADTLAEKHNHLFHAVFKNGSKFQGKSADVDPATHGGATLALSWIDEECDYEILRENQFRTRKGGKLLITATPLADVGTTAHPWIQDLIDKWRSGDPSIGVIFMATERNPYLSAEYIRRHKSRVAGLPDEQARLYGIPTMRSGLVYPMWKSAPPLWVPARLLPEKCYRAICIDPASTGPVAALWAAFNQRGKMTLYREYKEKGLTISQHVENILVENRGDPINLWLLDPFMGRQKQPEDHRSVLQVWRDAGLSRLRLADVDYAKALEESREYLKAAFDPTDPHPAVEVFDHLTKFEQEITRYVREATVRGPNRGLVRDKPRKGNDDLMNNFQYLAGMRLRAYNPDQTKLVDARLRSYAAQG